MFRFLISLAFIISIMLPCAGLDFTQAQEIPHLIQSQKVAGRFESKYVDLMLEFDDNSVRLKEASLYPGTIPTGSVDLGDGWYQAQILNAEKQVLYSKSFRDPAVRFYDEIDPQTEGVSGGYVHADRALYHLRLPLLDKAERLLILSPDKDPVYQNSISSIIATSRENAPPSQLWKTETLVYNGNPDNRIDLVFMGDGYILDDTTLFRNDVIEYINHMFTTSPYNEYWSYFNIHLVYVISAERGADHPEQNPPVYRNTALGAYYNCYDTPRLICLAEDTVYAIAQASFPFYDRIIVLVNDPIYGGAGGDITISYNGTWGKWVFNHEYGHSFGYLLDEYLYGNQPGTISGCNCDLNNLNPKWQPWINIGSPGVGAFPGCSWVNYFRPTYDQCTMNTLQDSFCVVCTEQLAKSINVGVLSFEDFYPFDDPTIELGENQNFYITPLTPSTHQLLTHWYVDGVPVGGAASDSFSITPQSVGSFQIVAVIFDSSELVINDPDYLMLDALEWQLDVVPPTAIGEIGGESLPASLVLYPNYPNPFNPETGIEYYLPSAANVSLQVYDVWGRTIKTLDDEQKATGMHRAYWNGTDKHGIEVASGVYFYVLEVDNTTRLTRKMMLLK